MCATTKTTTTTPTAYDARQQHIFLGDLVVYPTRRGSNLTMTEGEIVGIINESTVKVRREREAINFGNTGFIDVTARIVTVGTQQMVRL